MWGQVFFLEIDCRDFFPGKGMLFFFELLFLLCSSPPMNNLVINSRPPNNTEGGKEGSSHCLLFSFYIYIYISIEFMTRLLIMGSQGRWQAGPGSVAKVGGWPFLQYITDFLKGSLRNP